MLTVTFTRDEKLNAVSPAMIDGLRAAVDDLGDRDDLKVLVIAAEGRYFTAGIDLNDSGAGGRRGYAPDGSFSPRRLRRGYRSFHLLMDELEAIEKPSVLAAHARCLGVGLEIGASCDFRLAADDGQLRAAGAADARGDTGIGRYQPGNPAGRAALGQVAGVRRGGVG